MAYQRRLMKELDELTNHAPPALVEANDLKEWLVDVQVLNDNPLYQGQKFRLKFIFSSDYPVDSPQCYFVQAPDRTIPLHPHVYSVGYVCLNILDKDWSPVLKVSTLCLSIQSMLAGNTKAERPPDNDQYVSHAPSNPKHTRFHYHDDSV